MALPTARLSVQTAPLPVLEQAAGANFEMCLVQNKVWQCFKILSLNGKIIYRPFFRSFGCDFIRAAGEQYF